MNDQAINRAPAGSDVDVNTSVVLNPLSEVTATPVDETTLQAAGTSPSRGAEPVATDAPWSYNDTQRIVEAVNVLTHYGLPTRLVVEDYLAKLSEQRRQPSDDDLRWQRVEATPIADHISVGNDRPTLDSSAVVGRLYSLTPGQRDFIRDTYNMTPTKLVEVLEVAVFHENPRCIRRVILRSTDHIADPRRTKVINKLVIDHWGHFMSTAKANDDRRRDEAEAKEVTSPKDKATAPASASKTNINLKQLMEEYGV